MGKKIVEESVVFKQHAAGLMPVGNYIMTSVFMCICVCACHVFYYIALYVYMGFLYVFI